MIYLDNSATTLKKPQRVYEAVQYALENFGNAGRSFYDSAMNASREIYRTRQRIASLVNLKDPLQVAFTSSATESLNLVIQGLLDPEDEVITSVTEHNSVLRPLYMRGSKITYLDCDEKGVLCLHELEEHITPKTKMIICTHGSNVTGNITDAYYIYELCRKYDILFVLDVSQTLGLIETNADMADILVFTGHKGLFGPQGTGGVIVNRSVPIRIAKTGGSGFNSFSKVQPQTMPDIFEAGTLNSHSLYGLQKGVEYILEIGIEEISRKEKELAVTFYNELKHMEGIHFYGNMDAIHRLPVISFNIGELSSDEAALRLFEDYGIAVRSGIHCAPLLHKKFKTEEKGMIRFSFSYFNSFEEVSEAISAVKELVS